MNQELIKEREMRLGPAMERLNSRQQDFVRAVAVVGRNWQRAAEIAGYTGSAQALATQGWRLSRNPEVRAAMLEHGTAELAAGAPYVVDQLFRIVEDPRTEARDKLKALVEIANRCGLHSKTEHNINVTHEVGDRAAMIEALKMKVAANPEVRALLSPTMLEAIDAEFVEVETQEVVDDFEKDL